MPRVLFTSGRFHINLGCNVNCNVLRLFAVGICLPVGEPSGNDTKRGNAMSKRERVLVSTFFMTLLFIIFSPSVLLANETASEARPLLSENPAENAAPRVFWRVIDRWGVLVSHMAETQMTRISPDRAAKPVDNIQAKTAVNPDAACFESGCHVDLKMASVPNRHTPFAEGQCQVCHAMAADHGTALCSDCAPHVATMTDIYVCEQCHQPDSLGITHPVGTINDPETGGLMTCTSTCHDPHQSSTNYLLRHEDDGLCLRCHFK